MDTVDGTQLDLQQAAAELGVHYQTAYRWVRTGSLKAELIGGRYIVDRADIAAVDRSRRTPRTPPRPGPGRLDRAADRMYAALVAGDEPAARKIARRLVDEGTPMPDFIQDVIGPPLGQIGERWSVGELDVWVEHRASAIVERLLGELAPNPRGRRRGTAAVAALTGDHHALPTAMATAALRADNWHVQHFGADLPPDEIIRFCEDHDVAITILTVTNSDTSELADTTAELLRRAGTPAIVGGPGRSLHELTTLARDAVDPAAR